MSLTVMYQDIPIEYSEDRNQWVFTIRGRERWADSLKAAREAIDKPAPKDKKPFTPIVVWKDGGLRWSNNAGFVQIKITSLAESDYAGRPNVWLSDGKDRRKESIASLYADCPHNTTKIQQIHALRAEVAAIKKNIGELIEGLTPVVLPKDVE